jgi:phosphoribosyl-AMP cyclohydrolase / phosphoribosyl-ATP pyrophosphohydrolase
VTDSPMDPTFAPSSDRRLRTVADLDVLHFGVDGLIPVVTQERATGAVLMMAWASRDALEHTLVTGEMHYWSRSRSELWRKGQTSGNVQRLVSLHGDCDGDTVLAVVDSPGPACHTNQATCFGEGTERGLGGGPDSPGAAVSRNATPGPGGPDAPDPGAPGAPAPGTPRARGGVAASPSLGSTLGALWETLAQRSRDRPEGSYTVRLLSDENLRLKKLGEETAELVTALAKGGPPGRIREEGSDLLYHLLVALLAAGITPEELALELEGRRR